MDLWTGLATFAIIWWLVFFLVLPWGIRRIDPDDLGRGEDPGAPEKPRLLIKIAITTIGAGAVFGLVYMVVISGVISFRA